MADETQKHLQTWAWEAPLGLVLIGAGLSMVGQSIIYKAQGESAAKWVLWGTASLIVTNAGVSLFGDAVKHRALYEAKQDS